MSNLGHLWTYDHLCIKESPMHPNTCRTRVISMHCLCFKIYNSCFSQIPRFVGAASTPSWCPREILRPLLSELVIRLPLRSAFRFCLRHQEGVELQKFLTYSHSSLIPHGSLRGWLRQNPDKEQPEQPMAAHPLCTLGAEGELPKTVVQSLLCGPRVVVKAT